MERLHHPIAERYSGVTGPVFLFSIQEIPANTVLGHFPYLSVLQRP